MKPQDHPDYLAGQRLSDYDYSLPEDLIAQFPLAERTSSRLLRVTPSCLEDLHFSDLPSLLRPGDVLVMNNTRVIKARLRGHKETGGSVEALVERVTGGRTALAMMRSSKSPRPGARVLFENPSGGIAPATVAGRSGEFFILEFEQPVEDVLESFGMVPLPPYISRSPGAGDESRYQTVYASEPGAVAAPTAGLHFTTALLDSLRGMGVEEHWVTLHVGAGTFQPVREENLEEHVMHSEWFSVPAVTAAAVNLAKREGRRVVAVGSTSLRALESAAPRPGIVRPGAADTRLFIAPGYRFRVIDAMITNFHLPRSTLVMLVSAIAGRDRVMEAYRHAVEERYRFFSYGDACFFELGEAT